jgi:hypothetical protein
MSIIELIIIIIIYVYRSAAIETRPSEADSGDITDINYY